MIVCNVMCVSHLISKDFLVVNLHVHVTPYTCPSCSAGRMTSPCFSYPYFIIIEFNVAVRNKIIHPYMPLVCRMRGVDSQNVLFVLKLKIKYMKLLIRFTSIVTKPRFLKYRQIFILVDIYYIYKECVWSFDYIRVVIIHI